MHPSPGSSYLQEKKKFLYGSTTAVSALLHKKKTKILENLHDTAIESPLDMFL